MQLHASSLGPPCTTAGVILLLSGAIFDFGGYASCVIYLVGNPLMRTCQAVCCVRENGFKPSKDSVASARGPSGSADGGQNKQDAQHAAKEFGFNLTKHNKPGLYSNLGSQTRQSPF